MPLFQAASATRALIAPDVDTQNFKIHKSARFGNRFFQIVVAIGPWFSLSYNWSQVKKIPSMNALINLNWFLAIVSPFLAAGCVGIYLIPWFKKSWTSRKMLMTETSIDFVTFILWTSLFGNEVSTLGNGCDPTAPNTVFVDCDRFNWVLAWGAMSMIFWFFALALDVWAYLSGVYGWGERLSDGEADSVLRRLSKNSRARRF